MATNKFLTLVDDAGKKIRELATAISSFTGNANEIVATGTDGKISPGLITPATTTSLPTSDNLTIGDVVRIFDNAGTSTAGLADATSYDNRAEGYVLANTTAPGVAVVYLDGIITDLTGLTPGEPVYTSLTPGGITQTAIPEVSGNINQEIGIAISATEVSFRPGVATRFG